MGSKLATFRIDDQTWKDFQDKAKGNGTNASALFQRWVRDYLDGKIDNRIDSPAAPDVNIQTMIDDALNSKIRELREEDVNIQTMIDDALNSKIRELREEFEEHERIYQNQCQRGFELQIATFREEMNEAIATAKKPPLSGMRAKVLAA